MSPPPGCIRVEESRSEKSCSIFAESMGGISEEREEPLRKNACLLIEVGSAYPILLFVREAFSDGKRTLPVLATAGGKTQQEVPAPPVRCARQGPIKRNLALPAQRGVINRAPPCSRRLGLVGPDVARALVRVVWSLVAPLVRLWTQPTRKPDVITGRAAFEQGQGLRRPAIARQGAQLRVGVLQAARAGEAATAIARQIVALIEEGARVVCAVAARVVRHNAPAEAHRAVVEEATEAIAGSGVVGNGAVADGHRAEVVEATGAAAGNGVVGNGAVADGHGADGVVIDAGALAEGACGVVGNGAVADGHRADVEV